MAKEFEQLANTMTSAGAIASGLYGIANMFGDGGAADSYEYSRKMMKYQQSLNFESMDKAQELQKDMFEYTGFVGKTRQLKEAGLNPAILYGSGGGGGGTVGNAGPTSVSIPNAPNVGANANKIANIGMALNLAKLRSEIEVNQSIANKNNTDAGYTGGVGTKLAESQISNISTAINFMVQQTKSEVIKQESMKLDNIYKNIDIDIKEATKPWVIEKMNWDLQQAKQGLLKTIEETRKTAIDAKTAEGIYEPVVKEHNLIVQKSMKEILLLNSEIKLTDEKAIQISNSILQEWERVTQGKQKLQIDTMALETSIENTLKNNEAAMKREYVRAIAGLAQTYISGVMGAARSFAGGQ